MTSYDVIIIGGGPAGLSAALTLSRARRGVLVIDAGAPRNAPAEHAHNYLGLDGIPPRDLLARGRAEVTGYGGHIIDGTAVAARRQDDTGHFTVELADGTTVHGRRLVVTTGLVDDLPPIPGLTERWGRDVVHCPYCHGWEVRDQPIGIIGTGPVAVHQAQLWRQWSEHVTLFRNDTVDLTDDERAGFTARDVTIVDGPVDRLEITDDSITGVRMKDGRVVACRVVVTPTTMRARADVLAPLGLTADELRFGTQPIGAAVPTTDPTGATGVPGVWVAGNVTQVADQVIAAAAAGAKVGAMVNMDLVGEDTRHAVTARRSAFDADLEREVCEQVLGTRRHGL